MRAQALSAPARQLTPQADERGFRLELPAGVCPVLCICCCGRCPPRPFAQAPRRAPPHAAAPRSAARRRRPDMTTPGSHAAPARRHRRRSRRRAARRSSSAICAANKIQDKPYIYGGGHRSFSARGYDCSGTVSYALHGARPAATARSTPASFMRWGAAGSGHWITVYTNPGHAYAVDRRPAPRHQPRRHDGVRVSKRVRSGARERPALAPDRCATRAASPPATRSASRSPSPRARRISSRSASRLRRPRLRLALAAALVRARDAAAAGPRRPPVVVERRPSSGRRVFVWRTSPVRGVLGLDAHADLHRGAPGGVDRRVEGHQLAEVDRLEERHAVHAGGDHAAARVPDRRDRRRPRRTAS